MDQCKLRTGEAATLIPVRESFLRVPLYTQAENATIIAATTSYPSICSGFSYRLEQLFVDSPEITVAHDDDMVAGMNGSCDGCD